MYICLGNEAKTKTNDMTKVSELTGKTEKEIIAIYEASIETLIKFGCQEPEARKITRELFKETLGL